MTISDIYRAITELEEVVRSARGIGRWRLVDEELFLTCLQRMRASLPDEIRKAAELQRESERFLRAAREEARHIIDDARREAERLLEKAREEAERLLDDNPIVQQARQRAHELIAAAEQEAWERRRAADEYVQSVLARLERFAHRLLEVVAEGRQELEASPSASRDEKRTR
ncbi:hypothetical protein HRbin17_00365 [bacterium HR17]|uniref:ATPase n=1 Tax=Candidatus Fervidibacter japonicus TaxID=2035412 RepID=A0A2H5X9K7_9BACT|nr:hypothetical protein HRbin17_00365 [bacterium HR17]